MGAFAEKPKRMNPYNTSGYHQGYGDCVRACIASVLETHPSLIPHFFENNPDPDEAWKRIDHYLKRNHQLASFFVHVGNDVNGMKGFMTTIATSNPDTYYILFGTSRTQPHCVVCLNDKIVHDPSGAGIFGPGDGHVWTAVLFISSKLKA